METFKADRIVTINVDVQNDFCPGGALAVTEGDLVVAPLNELNAFTRENQGTVVFTGDQHPASTPHFSTWAGYQDNEAAAANAWPEHCIAGTEGAALRDDLEVLASDIIVDKGTGQTDGYSAFEGLTRDGRELAELITPIDRERVAVLLGGLATDYCVLNSALDAAKVDPKAGDIRVFVVKEAIRGVNIQPEDSDKAIEAMQDAGITIVETVGDITEQNLISIA